MPRNGSGTYTLPQAAFVPNTVISSSAMNSDLSDIANALTQSVSADGQTPLTGSLKGFAGGPSAPSYAFVGTPTTGMFPQMGGIGFAISGSLIGGFTLNGSLLANGVGVLQNVGYGGTVTQTGSISNPVTINTVCGQITTVNNTFVQGTLYSFTVNNSYVGAYDMVVVCQSGAGIGGISVVTNVTFGSFNLVIDPLSTVTATGTFTFMILKGAIT